MSNKLVPIAHCDLPKLRDLYKKDENLKFYTGYYTIDNYIRWFEKNPTISHAEVYSLNGDWSDGTYLILDRSHLLINTCSEDHSKIPQILALIDWTKEWDIFGYVFDIHEDVENFIHSNNLTIKIHTETYWYHLSKEDAMKFDVRIPKGFTLNQLSENNAETINSNWLHHKNGTINFIENLLKYNLSIGLFNDNEELIGWVLKTHIGTLGMLQVKNEYKRRGFGSLLVKALAKRLAETGDDSCATILTTNLPSLNMFEKLGFKPLNKLYWAENVSLK